MMINLVHYGFENEAEMKQCLVVRRLLNGIYMISPRPSDPDDLGIKTAKQKLNTAELILQHAVVQ